MELEVARVQRGGNFGHAQRHTLVAFLGFDDGVDGEKTDGVRQSLLWVCVRHGGGFFPSAYMNASDEYSGLNELNSTFGR